MSVRLQPNTTTYGKGDAVFTGGFIKNNYDFPLTNIDITARLFRKLGKSSSDEEAFVLVNEWRVKEDMVLEAKSQKQISNSWTLPLNANPGEYEVRLYVTDHNRFNVSGKAFTDIMEAWNYDFNVKGSKPAKIFLNRNNIQINNQQYKSDGGGLQAVKKRKDTQITFTLVNPTNQKEKIDLSYEVYKWSEQREKNRISKETESISIEGQDIRELAYTIQNPNQPVYLLRIEASRKGKTQSIARVRFLTEQSSRPRISMAGVTSNPLKGNRKIFVCLHNTSFSNTSVNINAKLLESNTGNVLSRISAEGNIGGSVLGLISSQSVKGRYSKTNLKVNLNSQGKQIDTFTITYDCKDLKNTTCPPKTNRMIYVLSGLVIVILSILLGGSIWYRRKKRNT